MIRKLIFLFFIISCVVVSPGRAKAVYDPRTLPNNKAGIHILDASEIDKASEVVNEGGEWGYATVPIQAKDRDKDKWQSFMKKAKELKIIPILRITTIPQGGTWEEGKDTDLVDFANFLSELEWPVKNRYIIIFNEVNRSQEWGDEVNPEKYALILKNAYTIFKERSEDFFILPAGLDTALPNSSSSMTARDYMLRMKSSEQDIWEHIDGLASHSYPNPGFQASPYKTGWQSITSYKQEIEVIGKDLPIFITETGWDQSRISGQTLREYNNVAWQKWLADKNVVAVTPFVLNAQDGPFEVFSHVDKDGGYTGPGRVIREMPKIKGEPEISLYPSKQPSYIPFLSNYISSPAFKPFLTLIRLENLIRSALNMPQKQILEIGGNQLIVEVVNKKGDITQGLSGRKRMDNNAGMLFIFEGEHIATFWMKDMMFPLDLIWIKGNTVTGISKNASPENTPPYTIYSPDEKINKVLEVNAGYVDENSIKEGDTIEIKEP